MHILYAQYYKTCSGYIQLSLNIFLSVIYKRINVQESLCQPAVGWLALGLSSYIHTHHGVNYFPLLIQECREKNSLKFVICMKCRCSRHNINELCLPDEMGRHIVFSSVVCLSVCLSVYHAFVSALYLLNRQWHLQITLHKLRYSSTPSTKKFDSIQ